MKTYQNLKWIAVTTLLVILLTACEDTSQPPGEQYLPEVKLFVKKVRKNAMMVDDIMLSDSWRLVREQGSYDDDGMQKEFDYNLLSDPDVGSYKEYWIFGEDVVMLAYSGDRFEKNWDRYYNIFHQTADLPNKKLTIDYVYDGGEKTFTRYWKITSITHTELILTDDDEEKGSFYQYTFRREDL